MITLDLHGLRCFVAVVDTASFSLAGQRIGRSQSAISLQLARLEDVLGKVLIDRRQGRVLGLTDDGRELLAYARQLLDLNDAACSALARRNRLGPIRLGVPADFMEGAFSDLLRRFSEAHRGVEVEVISDVSERLRTRMQDGNLDVAYFKQDPGENHGDFVARQRLLWVRGPMTTLPASVEPLPLVLFPEGCVFRSQILRALERAGRPWRVAYVCASMESVKLAIRQGLGISALPPETHATDLVELYEPSLPLMKGVEIVVASAANQRRDVSLLTREISLHIQERQRKFVSATEKCGLPTEQLNTMVEQGEAGDSLAVPGLRAA
jgi:DNA-binding transcriptional LysR family regulator